MSSTVPLMQLEDCIRDGTYSGIEGVGKGEQSKRQVSPLKIEAELNHACVLLFLWLRDLLEDKM